VEPDNPLFAGISAESIDGFWHREEFALQDDVEALARFVDGTPAITQRRHGKGRAILFATHLDMAFWEYRDPNVARFFDNLMRYCGIAQDIVIGGEQMDYIRQRVDAHLLSHNNQYAVLVNNEGNEDVDLTITIPAAQGTRTAVELFSGQALELGQNDGAQFSIHLPPEDGAVIMLD
jgi:hypothetical protein